MNTHIFWLLGITIAVQMYLLVYFHRKRKRQKIGAFSMQSKEDAIAMVKLLNAYNKMTAIKWYTDMMLDQDFGTLNIAQIQFLHQMSVDAEVALDDLRSITQFGFESLPENVKHMSTAEQKS